MGSVPLIGKDPSLLALDGGAGVTDLGRMGFLLPVLLRVMRAIRSMRFAGAVLAGLVRAQEFAPPLPFLPPLAQRTNLLRSLTLLQSSTAENPSTVRVLFYGQSITEQGWWRLTTGYLRETYPTARLVIENRAIGGHAAQLLVKTAEADLYPFQPDLLIFHVYGAHDRYEEILRRVRERTIADILLQTDHPTRPAMLSEETRPQKLTPKSWDAWMNHVFLPDVATRYGACRADIRELWKRHLRDTQLEPRELLRDDVHLNARGEFVMARLLEPYLAPLPQEGVASHRPFEEDRVQSLRWTVTNGTANGTFTGSRLDLKALPGPSYRVRIDRQSPTTTPGVVGFSRCSAFPQSNWPVLLRVGSEAAPIRESWTLTINEISGDGQVVQFQLRGSVTGDDGSGVSTNRFVSRSRRVVLEPGDWNLGYCYRVFHRVLAPGHPVTWSAEARGADTVSSLTPTGVAEAGWVTVAQGLSNRLHTVELEGVSGGQVQARAYRPPGGRE